MLKSTINSVYNSFNERQKKYIDMYLKTTDYILKTNYYNEFKVIYVDNSVYKISEAAKIVFCGISTIKTHIKLFKKMIEYVFINTKKEKKHLITLRKKVPLLYLEALNYFSTAIQQPSAPNSFVGGIKMLFFINSSTNKSKTGKFAKRLAYLFIN